MGSLDLADRLSGGALRAKVDRWRGEGLSAESITVLLYDEHGAMVSPATVRRWLKNLDEGGAAA